MVELIKEPVWTIEAFFALSCIEDADYESIMSHPQKWGKSKEEMQEIFKDYLTYKEAVLPELLELLNANQVIKKYVQKEKKNPYVILKAATLSLSDPKIRDHIPEYTEEELNKRITVVIITVINELLEIHEFDNKQPIHEVEELIAYLKDLDLNAEWKLLLIEVYVDQKCFYENFTRIAAQMAAIMKKNFGLICKDYDKRLERLAEPENLKMLTSGELGFRLFEEEDEIYHLEISIFRYNTLCFIETDHITGVHFAQIQIGIFFYELVNGKKEDDLSEHQFCTVCKALGDETRFRIIKLILQNKKMYLQALAKEVGLAPATISHHLNSLLQAEVIKVVVAAEKRIVYYELNREMMGQMGEYFVGLAYLDKEDEA